MTRSWEVRLARLFYHCANPFIRCGNHFQGAQQRRWDEAANQTWDEIKAAPWTWDDFLGPRSTLAEFPPDTHFATFAQIAARRDVDWNLLAEARRIWKDIAP